MPRDVKLARYLKLAEHNGMYRVIPALLRHWKRVCPDHLYSLRRILDLMSMFNGGKPFVQSRFAMASDGDGWQHTIDELLDLGADQEPGHEEWPSPLQVAVR